MRRLLKKIIQILDGTPAEYGKQRQAGQSMVELALVTPLLIILLAGLVEIGWFANNYLNILDVTRSGARRATVLVDDQSPTAAAWLPSFTYVPHSYLSEPGEMIYRMAYIDASDTDATRSRYRPEFPALAACGAGTTRLFYNEVICTMLLSLDPLVLDRNNGIDDIIITGYSLELIDPRPYPSWLPPAARPIPAEVPQLVVVGRYPTNANECDLIETSPGAYAPSPREPRDPFDFNMNNKRDVVPITGDPSINNDNDFTEREGYDDIVTTPGTSPFEPFPYTEKQVGFSLYGNHKIPGTGCIGSEWTMRQIEELMNIPNYEATLGTATERIDARGRMPGQGVVMVEMYWEHDMLLQIPVLSPVFTAVGNPEGKMVISIWAAFPLPSVEPFIIFPSLTP